MRVIAKRVLRDFWEKYTDSEQSLKTFVLKFQAGLQY